MPDRPYNTDLSDSDWTLVVPSCLQQGPVDGHAQTDIRAVVNAILYLLRTGCQWRLLPGGPISGTVCNYFRMWKNAGVWTCLQRAIYEQARTQTGRSVCPSIVGTSDIETARQRYRNVSKGRTPD